MRHASQLRLHHAAPPQENESAGPIGLRFSALFVFLYHLALWFLSGPTLSTTPFRMGRRVPSS